MIAGEVQKRLHLFLDALDVGVDLLARLQRPLGALAARVADQTGAAADERDGRVTCALQSRESHQRQQRAHVEAVGSRVEAAVRRARALGEVVFEVGRVVEHDAAPAEVV